MVSGRKEKGEFFSARRQTRNHKMAAASLELDPNFNPIYAAAFGHHIIDKVMSSKRSGNHRSTSSRITELFHDKFFQSVIYRYREGSTEIPIGDFFNTVSEDPTTADDVSDQRVGPNLVSVLIGRVGIGKSTFLSHLLITYRRALRARNLIPVIMDVERFAGPTASKNEFFRFLFIRIYDTVVESEVLTREGADNIFKRCQPTEVEDEVVRAKLYALAIKRFLVDLYWESGRRVFLCLDNIDKYYYLFDRGGFSEAGDQRRQAGMQRLADIIAEFESPSGALDGAGMNVLICMRRHTLDYFLTAASVYPSRRLNPIEDGSHVFRLAPSTPKQVISSRIELLKQVLASTPGAIPASDARQKIASLNAIWQSLEETREHSSRGGLPGISMLEDLSKLGNHGHRSLIDYFFSNTWILNDRAMMARFYKSYSPSILLFMLRNFSRYSQVECKIPNLFLVRGDIETASESFVPPELIKPHKHTYWLKYLIAHYIHDRKRQDKSVSIRELFDIFSPNEDGEKCFERHITELILGSLAQVDISGVIEPEFATSLDGLRLAIRDVNMTSRGALLLERFAFEFTYLQLVVEDYMLEFPELLFPEFKFFDQIDYQYLLQRHNDYQHNAIEMVALKSRQFFFFLIILEVTFKFEIQRRPITFEKLFGRGLAPPNFELIRKRLLEGILNIGLALQTERIESAARGAIESASLAKPKLEKFIRAAYLDFNV